MSVAKDVVAGNLRAAARLMRDLDDRMPGAVDVLRELYAHTGQARIVGITGNPGSGKSTLVDALVSHFRGEGLRVGVVAVDPSSPFSGGAILGDRIRMQRHALDDGVFIRSLASRGHLGGLSRSTTDVVTVLDALGFDVVLVETVGVGQAEVDIVDAAHVSVVVTVPGLGDEVQAIKAGILEIADVLCVNKADRPGAQRTVQDLQLMLDLGRSDRPKPPILTTVASRGHGVSELAEALDRFFEGRDGARWEASLRRRARHQLLGLVREEAAFRVQGALGQRFEEVVEQVALRRLDPYTATERLLEETPWSGPRQG